MRFRFLGQKIPWRRKWPTTPECLPRERRGQRSLVGCGPRVAEPATAERLDTTWGLCSLLSSQPLLQLIHGRGRSPFFVLYLQICETESTHTESRDRIFPMPVRSLQLQVPWARGILHQGKMWVFKSSQNYKTEAQREGFFCGEDHTACLLAPPWFSSDERASALRTTGSEPVAAPQGALARRRTTTRRETENTTAGEGDMTLHQLCSLQFMRMNNSSHDNVFFPIKMVSKSTP